MRRRLQLRRLDVWRKDMPRILIIDDSESMLAYLESILREASHEVFVASSGAEALKVLKKQALELAITDIYMPPPDGLEVMQFARAMNLNLPFIAISGRPPPLNMFVPARRLGARISIQKPFSPERLMEVVDAVLDAGLGSLVPDCQKKRRDRREEAAGRVRGSPPPDASGHSLSPSGLSPGGDP